MRLSAVLKWNLRFFAVVSVEAGFEKYHLVAHIALIVSLGAVVLATTDAIPRITDSPTLNKAIIAMSALHTFISFFESYRNVDAIKSAREHLRLIVRSLEEQDIRKIPISFFRFQTKFAIEMAVNFIIFLLQFSGKVAASPSALDLSRELFKLLRLLRKMLLLFHVELFLFVYAKLCETVAPSKESRNEMQERATRRNEFAVRKYHLCKLIYYKLWVASKQIEKHFGWTLLLACLEEFVFVLVWLFQLFKQWHLRDETEGLFRMFLSVLVLFTRLCSVFVFEAIMN